MGESYAAAGVDIAAGEAAVARIKRHVQSTYRPEVLGDVGGFGGLFAFDTSRYQHPVLVSSTDSVGTKALVAGQAGRLDSIGIDLVAMCVDDIAVCGAEPLFFLDTILVGSLDPDEMELLVQGVAAGCRQAGCALIGGEMAELPGVLEMGRFDLVGFAVGAVERDAVLTGRDVRVGDVIVGLPSPGLRSNGFSLARHVLLEQSRLPLNGPAWAGADHSLADELLIPSVIYAPALVAVTRALPIHALAHVTGGGLPGNLVRVLPDTCDAAIQRNSWDVPRIFSEISARGRVAAREMAAVFNLGIGMVAVMAPDEEEMASAIFRSYGFEAIRIGDVVAGTGQVRFD